MGMRGGRAGGSGEAGAFIRSGGRAAAVEQGLLAVGEAPMRRRGIRPSRGMGEAAQALGASGKGQAAGWAWISVGTWRWRQWGWWFAWCGIKKAAAPRAALRRPVVYLPETSRYQARWCCLAQARVTVPYHMARMVP